MSAAQLDAVSLAGTGAAIVDDQQRQAIALEQPGRPQHGARVGGAGVEHGGPHLPCRLECARLAQQHVGS